MRITFKFSIWLHSKFYCFFQSLILEMINYYYVILALLHCNSAIKSGYMVQKFCSTIIFLNASV